MNEEPKTIQQLVSESLEASRDEIIKNGIDGVKQAVTDQVKWKIGWEIEQAIKDLFEDEAVKAKLGQEMEKVKLQLIEGFASELTKVVPTIAATFAVKLQEKAIKNLMEDNYSTRDIYKKLFD